MLTAHFDGKVLIPDKPVNLPVGCALEVHVQPLPLCPIGGEGWGKGEKHVPVSAEDRPLMKLVKLLEELPDNPDTPTDGAAQHDHYLYGLPKRP
jgi:hypothetical protein